jgi:hypothetical protein
VRNSDELQKLISELREKGCVTDYEFEFETGDGQYTATPSLDGTLIVTGLTAQEVLWAIDNDDTQIKIGALRNLVVDMLYWIDRVLRGSTNKTDLLKEANTLRHRAYMLECEVLDVMDADDE